MKKVFILFCIFIGVLIESVCQASLDGNRLTIDAKCTTSKVDSNQADKIQHIIFDGSKLNEIDSTWSVFKDIKSITFLDNATIPRNLKLVNSSYNLEFKNYIKSIRFPNDFPFGRIKEISFIYVSEIPSDITAFTKAYFFEFYSIEDKNLAQKIRTLDKIKHLRLSEVSNFDVECLCSLKELENLELTQLIFSTDKVDLKCVSSLISIYINDTNARELYLTDVDLKEITLEKNNLSLSEIDRISKEFEQLKTKISP